MSSGNHNQAEIEKCKKLNWSGLNSGNNKRDKQPRERSFAAGARVVMEVMTFPVGHTKGEKIASEVMLFGVNEGWILIPDQRLLGFATQ